jgi:hypothetical protein
VKNKYLLWSVLITILIIILGSSFGGCTPKGIKPLTDDEKAVMIEIALAHPEVEKWLETADKYTTEVGWVAIGWHDGKATGWSRLDYEEIADGNLPSDITYPAETVTIHPRVNIRVGEPVRRFIYVAFDRETKEVVDVQLAPGR